MKRFLVKLSAAAVSCGLLLSAGAVNAHAEPVGGSLIRIDASKDRPNDYKSITGFELTYKLTEGGAIGDGTFLVNALMIALGDAKAEDFAMDYSAAVPSYVGSAKELITHCTGDGSFVGPMFFGHGVDANQGDAKLKVGETATVKYEGETALFSDTNSFITAFGIFGEFELVSVKWISGEINETAETGTTWSRVETVKYNDVPTVENGTKYNYVNITVPKGAGPYPVIFWIHGGGWSSLDRTSFFISDTKEYLLSKGFAIVSAEYTLCEAAGDDIVSGYPQMIYDLKAAVRFIRANAGKYNLDTSFIAAMGESAGAHLAMLMGTTNGSKTHEDLTMGNAGYSSDVQAMISYFGPSDAVDNIMGYAIFGSGYTEELAKAASPYWQITKAAPPLFLTHGENDAAVPIEHSYKMEAKAKELIGAQNVTAVYYKDAPHASKAAFDKQSAMDAVWAFLSEQLPNAAGGAVKANPNTGDASSNLPIAATACAVLAGLGVAAFAAAGWKKRVKG